MIEERGVGLKNILRRFLLKGVLVSIVVFFIAMFINATVVLVWFSNNDVPLTSVHWSIIGVFLGGYPLVAYVLLGFVRSLTVLYSDVFASFIKPKISVVTDLSISKIDEKMKVSKTLNKEFGSSIILGIMDSVDSSLSKYPKIIRNLVNWVLRKSSIEEDLLPYIESVENLTPETMSAEVSQWIEENLSDLVEGLKPFWFDLLIPLHVALLIGLWFIHLINI